MHRKSRVQLPREKVQQRMEAGAVVLFLVGEQGARAADVQAAGGKNRGHRGSMLLCHRQP